MVQVNGELKRCDLCKDEYTSINTEAMPGVKIYVCNNCLEAAKENFFWVCMSCGNVYSRPKKMVIERMQNVELKRAYLLCEDKQIIQGIDTCIACDPEGILEYTMNEKVAMEC